MMPFTLLGNTAVTGIWVLLLRRQAYYVVNCLLLCLSGQAPLYLADDWRLVSDSTRRSLRSADVSTCVVPRTLSSYGHRTFAAAGPYLWNSLPVQLRNPDITYGLFRRQLKGYLFREARTQRSVISDMRHHRKNTYLLTRMSAPGTCPIYSTCFLTLSEPLTMNLTYSEQDVAPMAAKRYAQPLRLLLMATPPHLFIISQVLQSL